MKEITVISGKGGTGKTSITAALASVAWNAVFCDSDVDAADLHLIFQPHIVEEHSFSGGWKAIIDSSKCKGCNACLDHCRFDAIHTNGSGQLQINLHQCEGCRLCERICPAGAITSERSSNNFWYVSESRFGKLVHAHMGPGEENSGKLVTQVRKRAAEIALQMKSSFILSDGPPGIGCPVISSLAGTNTALIVTEPSKSGLHDTRRLVELIRSFQIKSCAVINKYDINHEMTKEIESYLNQKQIPLLAKIPFDKQMTEALIRGQTIVEYKPHSEISILIQHIWKNLESNTS